MVLRNAFRSSTPAAALVAPSRRPAPAAVTWCEELGINEATLQEWGAGMAVVPHPQPGQQVCCGGSTPTAHHSWPPAVSLLHDAAVLATVSAAGPHSVIHPTQQKPDSPCYVTSTRSVSSDFTLICTPSHHTPHLIS